MITMLILVMFFFKIMGGQKGKKTDFIKSVLVILKMGDQATQFEQRNGIPSRHGKSHDVEKKI